VPLHVGRLFGAVGAAAQAARDRLRLLSTDAIGRDQCPRTARHIVANPTHPRAGRRRRPHRPQCPGNQARGGRCAAGAVQNAGKEKLTVRGAARDTRAWRVHSATAAGRACRAYP